MADKNGDAQAFYFVVLFFTIMFYFVVTNTHIDSANNKLIKEIQKCHP